jgi:phenylpyruvate tautomerase PptA (4-oxalocrotonate tautomerase family)
MPLYQCISPEGLLDDSGRENIAGEITRIHCNATGAPPSFVNVLFLDTPSGTFFIEGRPSNHSVVRGAIRQGRSVATRQAMLRDLSQMWARVTGQSEGELLVVLSEVPSENVMEAGLILPNPGHEEQWFEENRTRLTALGHQVTGSL